MANIQVLAILGVLLVLVSPASIAMSPQDTPAEVKSCKTIADDKERLRCFDGLFGGPSKPQQPSEERQVGESPEAKQGNWSIDETKSSDGSPQVVAANLVGDISRRTETRVDHLCCRDQRRHNSGEAFRTRLQLKRSLEDRSPCLQNSLIVITKSLAKTASSESLQANELLQR